MGGEDGRGPLGTISLRWNPFIGNLEAVPVQSSVHAVHHSGNGDLETVIFVYYSYGNQFLGETVRPPAIFTLNSVPFFLMVTSGPRTSRGSIEIASAKQGPLPSSKSYKSCYRIPSSSSSVPDYRWSIAYRYPLSHESPLYFIK